EVVDGGGVEPHLAMDTGIVKEVAHLPLHRAVRGVFDVAGRNSMPAQAVVDPDCNPYFFAGRNKIGDIGFQRQVTTFVLCHMGIANPDICFAGGRVEAENNTLIVPAARLPNGRLVEDGTNYSW